MAGAFIERGLTMQKLKEGDVCKLKDNDYMWCKIRKILPKGSHGKRYLLAECLTSSTNNFDFALVKTFRLSSLRAT